MGGSLLQAKISPTFVHALRESVLSLNIVPGAMTDIDGVVFLTTGLAFPIGHLYRKYYSKGLVKICGLNAL